MYAALQGAANEDETLFHDKYTTSNPSLADLVENLHIYTWLNSEIVNYHQYIGQFAHAEVQLPLPEIGANFECSI